MMLTTPLLIFLILLNHQIACEPSVKNPNIALLKPAKQSSVKDTLGAHYSVDGSTTNRNLATILWSDNWQWLLVDLEELFTIISFRLSHLNGCCSRVQEIIIEVTAQDPTSLGEFPGFITNAEVCFSFSKPPEKGITYTCDMPVTGRYIRIVRRNSNRKNLAVGEFEVYTHLEPNVLKIGNPFRGNLALNKPASASSFLTNATPNNAFDGILDGDLFRRSCFHTDREISEWEWLTVDLQGTLLVDSVRIMNRIDCCQDRAQNFTMEMSKEDPTTLIGFPGNAKKAQVCHRQIDIMTYTKPVVYNCDRPILARYVRMVKSVNDGKNFNICELEVFSNVKKNHYRKVSTSNLNSTFTSKKERRYAFKCTQVHGVNTKNMDMPYIHADLDNGRCRFLQSEGEKNAIPSTNWAVYQLD